MSPVPYPRTPTGPAGRTVIRRDLPGDRVTWTARSARISGLLLALSELEAAGVAVPAPVADRRVLRAWARSAGPVVGAAGLRGDQSGASFTVDLDDVDALAEAGRALALLLCRARQPISRPGDPDAAVVVQTLHRVAMAHDIAAEQLVAELGRAARLLAPAHLRTRAAADPVGA
ncbi:MULTISPECIES: hypothetical protein [Pseudonocardia]|uniref:Uncharacterized protein n=2 Tax=Pseudonocardia TaxID=1847 RepID=A0A1Y2N2P7_PSEAH|nr:MULTISPECIES: hypothetical protein [Pseudonocardia]OSY41744.1 hypothetical protein BG845_01772 [Pseudonocardia autotrophica]TDN71204.1 hypothetical protein C8E95_0231 [Pseudonocardia autotrophica]BBG01875.1 hypothetical protein Pdca_30840 [Pseudonocardia autotrophica]GEC23040.1 hypothetical protein PSA01_00690 [Pseudonocardia saturnea]